MRIRRYELDTRVLAVFFFVAIPFVAVGALAAISMARRSLEQASGEALEERAQETEQFVERHVAEQLRHLGHLSRDAMVRAAFASPARPLPSAEEQKRHDQAWATSQPDLLRSVVGSQLAQRLRETTELIPAMRLIQLVDAEGRLVASSVQGGRLWNARSPWFSAVMAEGGAAQGWVGELHQPAGSTGRFLELAYPVRDADDVHATGAVRALLDADQFYEQALAPVRVGSTGRAMLVRAADGAVLMARTMAAPIGEKAEGFEFIAAARAAGRGYWVTPERDLPEAMGGGTVPSRVMAFSPVDGVAGGAWMVVVQQELSEAIAPVKGIAWYLLLHFVAVVGAALVLAFYVSFRLEAPVIEEELHLHEEHVPSEWKHLGTAAK